SLLEPTFGWLPSLPPKYILREVRLSTLGEARKLEEPAFVKPADDKCFLAGVFTSGEELPVPGIVPAETPVLIAEPVVWEVEFRCFVLQREVVTISPYLKHGKLAQDAEGRWQDARTEEARTFAKGVFADEVVALPSGVAVDVGLIQDR